MNAVEDPVAYLGWQAQPNTLHLLQYPELHPTDYLVKFFRIINLSNMMAQYDHTQHTHQIMRQFGPVLREPYLYIIKKRLKVTLSDYLILDVTREQPLKDTLDQLWKQERVNLLKPLKVKLGQQEGEVGLDHGGVTYEFFRVVLGEAFTTDFGKQIEKHMADDTDIGRDVHGRFEDADDVVPARLPGTSMEVQDARHTV